MSRAERRLDNGFAILASYTFGKLISDSEVVPSNFGAVEVAPENVQFESVEPATPEELNEPIERLLGLEQHPERERPADLEEGEEDFEAAAEAAKAAEGGELS